MTNTRKRRKKRKAKHKMPPCNISTCNNPGWARQCWGALCESCYKSPAVKGTPDFTLDGVTMHVMSKGEADGIHLGDGDDAPSGAYVVEFQRAVVPMPLHPNDGRNDCEWSATHWDRLEGALLCVNVDGSATCHYTFSGPTPPEAHKTHGTRDWDGLGWMHHAKAPWRVYEELRRMATAEEPVRVNKRRIVEL